MNGEVVRGRGMLWARRMVADGGGLPGIRRAGRRKAVEVLADTGDASFNIRNIEAGGRWHAIFSRKREAGCSDHQVGKIMLVLRVMGWQKADRYVNRSSL